MTISITFKTITQQTFQLEFEEDGTTVAQVKEKIAAEKGATDFAVELQKLIYNGKILENEQKLSELSIDPKKFVVVMVSRPKKVESSSAETSSASKPSVSTTTEQKKEEAKAPAASATTPAAQPSAEVPQEHLATVETITGMGYPRDEVVRALKVAFYDADRAVEYLCTGIPEALNLHDVVGLDDAAADQESHESDNEGEAEGGGLEFLQNSPQFQNLRELVRANPALLPQIVASIASTNPELMDAIRNNQADFLQLLNAPPLVGEGGAANPAVAAAGGGAAVAGAAGGAPPGVVTISVSEEDRNAIQRLVAMGFPEQLVIEAYITCDKNEELAINYILQRMDEFHEEANQGGGT